MAGRSRIGLAGRLGLAVVAIGLAACVGTQQTGPQTTAGTDTQARPTAQGGHDRKAAAPELALQGTRWHLLELAGSQEALAEAGRPNLLLNAEGKAASGFAGCNSFFGTYTLEGSSLRFSNFGITKRYCGQKAMALESQYLGALGAVASLQRSGNRLSLLDESGQPVLRFEADPRITDTNTSAGASQR